MQDVKTLQEMRELIGQGFGILFNKKVYTRVEDLPTESEVALSTDDEDFVEKTKEDALAEIERLQKEIEKLNTLKTAKAHKSEEVKTEDNKKKEDKK